MWSVVHEYQKGNLDGERFIDLMHDHGVQGVELLDFFWKDKEAELPRAVDKIKQYHMEVACYSIGNDFVASCPKEREKQIEYVREGIDDAVKIGANKLRVFSGNPKEGITYEQGGVDNRLFQGSGEIRRTERYHTCIRKSWPVCRKKHSSKGNNRKVASPNLRAAADTGNFLLVGENRRKRLEIWKDTYPMFILKILREQRQEKVIREWMTFTMRDAYWEKERWTWKK